MMGLKMCGHWGWEIPRPCDGTRISSSHWGEVFEFMTCSWNYSLDWIDICLLWLSLLSGFGLAHQPRTEQARPTRLDENFESMIGLKKLCSHCGKELKDLIMGQEFWVHIEAWYLSSWWDENFLSLRLAIKLHTCKPSLTRLFPETFFL